MTARLQSPLQQLMLNFPREGSLRSIGLRPRHRASIVSVQDVQAITDHGLAGDHAGDAGGRKRQVTLIQWEHLSVLARLLGRYDVEAALLRRNLVVSGINVLALRNCTFAIGHVVLSGTGICAPCSRMEAALGVGGLNAMRGHGGITARVIAGGVLRVGDMVQLVEAFDPTA